MNIYSIIKTKRFFILLFFIINAFLTSYSQEFGQNKPSYKTFNFKVYRTPHFELYHYLKNDSVLNRLAQLSEQWYTMHQQMFRDTFKSQNPIIFYNDHADFQQTTAVSGLVDVGTGGVTEAFKNRVILPIAQSYAQTNHVLGHEMVHAFQYHALLGDSANYNNLRNLPLWMIEGMAEYFSIGSIDAHTSLWMRDAIVNNDFPTLEMMTLSNQYFPYRFGQCFWAMVGRTWGDSLIMPLFKETAMFGYPFALKKVLGYDETTFSSMWKTALVSHFQKYLDVALTIPVGNKILFAKNAGDMNLSPSLSPDGKYVIFLSEKDLFTLELFLADARTGKIIRKISSTVHNNEIDAFNYIESSGSWSPDGKRFIFTVYTGGRNKLLMVNVEKGRTVGEFEIPGVPAFSNPAWSPTGNSIVVSGIVEGVNNLYLFDLKTKNVTQLTNDPYSYIQPTWSNDGKYIAFSTDKPINPGSFIDPNGGMSIGIINMDTKQTSLLEVFKGAKNLNPQFSTDNKSIYFLSNRDGFRNLYHYNLDSAKVYQNTQFFTGITGITEFSPAISIARDKDLISYSYFYGGKYSIYSANKEDFKSFEVRADSINFDAATLPPLLRTGNNTVDKQLSNRDSLPFISTDKFMISPYRPKFQLDYISQVNAGVATSRFGTGMAGSVLAIFSDIVGQNQLYTILSVNGEIYDFGGQLAYVNSKHKINMGAMISHIPYTYAYQDVKADSIMVDNKYVSAINYPTYIYRNFEDRISLFAMRPLSKTQRIEFGISNTWNYQRREVRNEYYDYNDNWLSSNKEKLESPPGYNNQIIDAAFVSDNSFFGMTAPMRGSRSRIGVEKYFGEFSYVTGLVDYRQYIFKKPYTLAFRLLHYGRYGQGADDDRLRQMYLGYPWYLRGYDYQTFADSKVAPDNLSINMNDLFGSKMGLFSVEFRIPFTGPKKIALIESGFLMSDLVLFADAGITWDEKTNPDFKFKKSEETDRIPLFSTGISLRVNLFGYIVIEPYCAFPLLHGGFQKAIFGINFMPGW